MARREPQIAPPPIRRIDAGSKARRCDWPDCENTGEFRAPKDRERMRDYYWFCLDHIKVYNASWNYYAGMSEDEVEADRRRDTTWDRPSWPLGARLAGKRWRLEDVVDDFGVTGEGAEDTPPQRPYHPETEEERALEVLGLKPPVSAEDVKARYKELVKLYHPDANGGDKSAEERFKQVGEAYETVMESMSLRGAD